MVRSFIRASVVMAAATALTACASSSAQLPSQRALTADVTASTFEAAPAVAARQTAALSPDISRWWTGFQDQTLNEMVDRALAQNLDLAAAGARVVLADRGRQLRRWRRRELLERQGQGVGVAGRELSQRRRSSGSGGHYLQLWEGSMRGAR